MLTEFDRLHLVAGVRGATRWLDDAATGNEYS